MLTPRFTIDQTNEYVLIHIIVPYVRIGGAEIVTVGQEFSFYCKPYLLKLSFPHRFVEDEEENKAA